MGRAGQPGGNKATPRAESCIHRHPNPWPDLVTSAPSPPAAVSLAASVFPSLPSLFCSIGFCFPFSYLSHLLFTFYANFPFLFRPEKNVARLSASRKANIQQAAASSHPVKMPLCLPFHLQMALEHFIARQRNGNVPKSMSWLRKGSQSRSSS